MGEKNSPLTFNEEKYTQFIYDDIDDVDIFGTTSAENEKEAENIDQQPLPSNEVIEENESLKKEMDKYKSENELLRLRISELYLTAKAEMERKDKRLGELKNEMDILLARKNTHLQNKTLVNKCQREFSNEEFQRFDAKYKIPKRNNVNNVVETNNSKIIAVGLTDDTKDTKQHSHQDKADNRSIIKTENSSKDPCKENLTCVENKMKDNDTIGKANKHIQDKNSTKTEVKAEYKHHSSQKENNDSTESKAVLTKCRDGRFHSRHTRSPPKDRDRGRQNISGNRDNKYYSNHESRSRSTEKPRQRGQYQKNNFRNRSKSRENYNSRHRVGRRSRSLSRERFKTNRHTSQQSYSSNNSNRFRDHRTDSNKRLSPKSTSGRCNQADVQSLRQRLLRYRHRSLEKDRVVAKSSENSTNNSKLPKNVDDKDTVTFSDEDEIQLFLSGESDHEENRDGEHEDVLETTFNLLKDQIDIDNMTEAQLESLLKEKQLLLEKESDDETPTDNTNDICNSDEIMVCSSEDDAYAKAENLEPDPNKETKWLIPLNEIEIALDKKIVTDTSEIQVIKNVKLHEKNSTNEKDIIIENSLSKNVNSKEAVKKLDIEQKNNDESEDLAKNIPKDASELQEQNVLKDNQENQVHNKDGDTIEMEAAKTLCSLSEPLDFNDDNSPTKINKNSGSVEDEKLKPNDPEVQTLEAYISGTKQETVFSTSGLEQELYISDDDDAHEDTEKHETHDDHQSKPNSQKVIILSDVKLDLREITKLGGTRKGRLGKSSSECIESIQDEINSKTIEKTQEKISRQTKPEEAETLDTTELQLCLEGSDHNVVDKKTRSPRKQTKNKSSSRVKNNVNNTTRNNKKNNSCEKIRSSAEKIKMLFGPQSPIVSSKFSEENVMVNAKTISPNERRRILIGKAKRNTFSEELLLADTSAKNGFKVRDKNGKVNKKQTGKIEKENIDEPVNKDEKETKNIATEEPKKVDVFCNSLTYIPSKNSAVPFDSPNSFITKKIQSNNSKKIKLEEQKNITDVSKTKNVQTNQNTQNKKQTTKNSRVNRRSPVKRVTRSTRKTNKRTEESPAQNKGSSWKIRFAENSKKRNRSECSNEDSGKKKKLKTDEDTEKPASNSVTVEDKNPNLKPDTKIRKPRASRTKSSDKINIEEHKIEQERIASNEALQSRLQESNKVELQRLDSKSEKIEPNSRPTTLADVIKDELGDKKKVVKRITPRRIGDCTRKKKGDNARVQLFTESTESTENRGSECVQISQSFIESSVVSNLSSSVKSDVTVTQPAPNSSPLPSFERYIEQSKSALKNKTPDKPVKSENFKSSSDVRTSDYGEFPDIHIDPITLMEKKEIDNIIIDLNISDKSLISLANGCKSKSDKDSNDDPLELKDPRNSINSLDFSNFLSKNKTTSTPVKSVTRKAEDKVEVLTEKTENISSCSNPNVSDKSFQNLLEYAANSSGDNSGVVKSNIQIGVPLRRDRRRRPIVMLLE
ncbi:probable WRKY transcription factor protein 1 isoform X2 [Sitophilus oryzae]|uniref:Probable WRKY transcription factor protein 1 isoform X2 n=1 Tax=Sitophilus oryzae TaxID=7048 RepID=A0A6J2YBZ4_SITOR|nr:probable WRKY transcription factor protein 1 isoform X2 [Sitophilus oryzae]